MGIVEKAAKSLRDGFVRNVEVKYKNVGAKTFTTVTRPVQRLIVLLKSNDFLVARSVSLEIEVLIIYLRNYH